MKFETQAKKLKESLSLIDGVAGKHISLPVLVCVVIEVKKNTVFLRATNLDVGIEVSFPAKTNKEGVVAVPAKTLSSIISSIYDNNQSVVLEVVNNNLKITTNKLESVVKTMPNEDFPTIPRINEEKSIKIDTTTLTKGFRSVSYSASVSGVKPELSSVYMYTNDGYVVFAATDSFRLAERKIKAPTGAKIQDTLIPFKNIQNITHLLEQIGGEIDMRSNKNLISFENQNTYIVSRIIDGVFPDYKQIIPKNYITEAVLLKQDVVNALKTSNIFSDKFNQIKLIIKPKDKKLEIQTKNSDIGENKTQIDAAITGENTEINFNHKYISDCLQSIETDSLSMEISGANKPMIIKPVSGEQTFMYLVMPMNR